MKQIIALCAIGIALFAVSCKKVVRNEAYYEAMSRYIYAYTSGDIGRTDPIRVRFVDAAVGQDKIGKPVTESIFSVSPAITGTPIWEDDRTILLQPSEPLPYGKKYAAALQIGKIYKGVPAEVERFEFDFRVRELSFEISTKGVQAENPQDLKLQKITGTIATSDPVAADAMEKMLRATQGNKQLNIQWSHSENGMAHGYSIGGVERSNVRSRVLLEWDGSSIGIEKKGNQEVIIPSLDEFVVLSAAVVQQEEQYVLINFSDPIQSAQVFDGLLRLEDYASGYRFAVDGNFVRLYPSERISGSHQLRVEAGIKNLAGAGMKERSDWPLDFVEQKPSVRLVGKGAIIPQESNGSVIFPFEAVGLKAVDVEVFKIFNSNILQYLQVNEIEGDQELDRVGKIIAQRKVDLSQLNPTANFGTWQRYALDLSDIIKQDPGAIYQVRFAFRRGYAVQNCETATESDDAMAHLGTRDEDGNLESIMGSYRGIYFSDEDNWYWGDDDDSEDDGRYRWNNRTDPCKREYYNYEHFVSRNVFVSDLGITAKRGKDGSIFSIVTNLHTTEAISGVNLEFFNYQLQSIGKYTTDGTGTVMVTDMKGTPFVAVATRDQQKGYLRMADGNSLSLSRFDVAGVEPQKGLKGYIYGERGVWRPGDSLFLNFVLEDKTGKLPADHPVTFELSDPRGSLQYRTVSTRSEHGVYALPCTTRSDAPTGNWTAKVMVGGATFTKLLKIETVKPNRLKMDLDFGRKQLLEGDENLKGNLTVKWLHGAVAKNLKARVEMQLKPGVTTFPNFKGFVFEDPARSFYSEPQILLDGALDDNGKASVPLQLEVNGSAPGKLIANFKVRAFEAGGDFSTDNFALDYFPYKRFVGIAIPEGRWGGKTIDKNGEQIQFVCLDTNGKPQAGRKIEVGLYRCDWRWWWDENYADNVAQFNSADHFNARDHATLTTDSRGIATWKVKPGTWGRFLIRASDPDGGHSTGDFFWSGAPDELQDIQSRNEAAMLPFTADKAKYNVGESVTLKSASQ
ncbi:MAG: hypothetical protein IPL65_19715 [Lewinellaceae bacterium]|nr:hypothetical protein [Lewinellaceae bacterium]